MSKRKNRKQSSTPNIPRETLERARREAGLEPEIPEEEPITDATPEETDEELVIAAPQPSPSRRRSSDSASAAQRPSRQRRRKELAYEEMTNEEVIERLANPTKVVSQEELKRDYGYVIADLRSMAILAGVLFVALIVIAQVLVV